MKFNEDVVVFGYAISIYMIIIFIIFAIFKWSGLWFWLICPLILPLILYVGWVAVLTVLMATCWIFDI